MITASDPLRAEVDRCLAAGNPADAVCYLAEMVGANPADRNARLALAITLGDAGYRVGAIKVMQALASRLAHEGFLLPAMVVVRHGLERAPSDPTLLATLRQLHVRGVRAKAGNLPVPPPLKGKRGASTSVTAQSLLTLSGMARFDCATQIGTELPPAGAAAVPVPMPLFSELDEAAFVETVRRLTYRRVASGTELMVEGKTGFTLLVIASGQVIVQKGGGEVARIGPGAVLGEMALLTGAPRSATAIAAEDVEFFELARGTVLQLTQEKPHVAEELLEYCRKRLVDNLLRTSPMFARFNEEARFQLLGRFQRRGYQPGERIIVQGTAGAGLFVLATGEVEVSVLKDAKEPVVVANLGVGEVFGEISLLHDRPTTATVAARDRVGALFLPREDFRRVLDEHPTVRQYLEQLSMDRLKASQAAKDAVEVMDAGDLIVL